MRKSEAVALANAAHEKFRDWLDKNPAPSTEEVAKASDALRLIGNKSHPDYKAAEVVAERHQNARAVEAAKKQANLFLRFFASASVDESSLYEPTVMIEMLDYQFLTEIELPEPVE